MHRSIRLVVLVLLLLPTLQKRITPIHILNIGDARVKDLLQTLLPDFDFSKPLYDLGNIISKGGRGISPNLMRAGQISTSIGVIFINFGTLMISLAQLLSDRGAIGGNPNFLNELLGEYLVKKSNNSTQLTQGNYPSQASITTRSTQKTPSKSGSSSRTYQTEQIVQPDTHQPYRTKISKNPVKRIRIVPPIEQDS